MFISIQARIQGAQAAPPYLQKVIEFEIDREILKFITSLKLTVNFNVKCPAPPFIHILHLPPACVTDRF
jgi:hypothetical protein